MTRKGANKKEGEKPACVFRNAKGQCKSMYAKKREVLGREVHIICDGVKRPDDCPYDFNPKEEDG